MIESIVANASSMRRCGLRRNRAAAATRKDPRRRAVRMRVLDAFCLRASPRATLPVRRLRLRRCRARTLRVAARPRLSRGARAARLSIVSGTHAIVASLDALLAPARCCYARTARVRYAALRAGGCALLARGAWCRVCRGRTHDPGDTTRRAGGRTARETPAVVFVQRSRVTRRGVRYPSPRSSGIVAVVREQHRRRSSSSTTATANWSKSASARSGRRRARRFADQEHAGPRADRRLHRAART